MDSSNATFSFMFLVNISYKSLILRVVLELCSFAPVALISLFSSVWIWSLLLSVQLERDGNKYVGNDYPLLFKCFTNPSVGYCANSTAPHLFH